MSGICDTCRHGDCGLRMDGLKHCDMHERPDSRYTALFGTPERAAQLIADNCEYLSYCGQCWVRAANCDGKYSTVLEWLKGADE